MRQFPSGLCVSEYNLDHRAFASGSKLLTAKFYLGKAFILKYVSVISNFTVFKKLLKVLQFMTDMVELSYFLN